VTVGAALNTQGLGDAGARAACADAQRSLGLPATDPVRFGADALAEAVIARIPAHRAAAPGPRGDAA
jgi:uncharacterized NAD-dependent epimerase/dehydratase family protein